MMPGILEIFIKLAKEYNIPCIRYMDDNSKIAGFCPAKYFRALVQSLFKDKMKRALDASSIKHANRLLGFIDSGHMDEERLAGMLRDLGDGVTELITHPGFMGPEVLDRYRFHMNCERELSALTSPHVKEMIKEGGIELGGYAAFLSGRGI